MDPAADNTDLYAFVSPERPGYVTFIADWMPFSEPDGGPNFYPFATDARYYINIDNDGDGVADARFRWTFQNVDNRGNSTFLYDNGPVTSLDDENLLFRQTYTLESSFDEAPFRTRISDAPVARPGWGRRPCRTMGHCVTRQRSRCRAAGRCSPGRLMIRSSWTYGSSICYMAAT
jgi:hypothetical protein